MLAVVFNIEATFIMTLIKQEYLCHFTKDFLRVPGYPNISNFGYPVPVITKNSQSYI